MNGDGIDDVLVGAPSDTFNAPGDVLQTKARNGSVWVIYGEDTADSSTSTSTTSARGGCTCGAAAAAERLGTSVAGLGRFNQGAVDDFAIGAQGFYGVAGTSSAERRGHRRLRRGHGGPGGLRGAAVAGAVDRVMVACWASRTASVVVSVPAAWVAGPGQLRPRRRTARRAGRRGVRTRRTRCRASSALTRSYARCGVGGPRLGQCGPSGLRPHGGQDRQARRRRGHCGCSATPTSPGSAGRWRATWTSTGTARSTWWSARPRLSVPGRAHAGGVYVIYGNFDTEAGDVDIRSFGGYRILDPDANAFRHRIAAGDVSGDSVDDVLIGMRDQDRNGRIDSGSVYWWMGQTTASVDLDLADAQPARVTVIDGEQANNRTGRWVGRRLRRAILSVAAPLGGYLYYVGLEPSRRRSTRRRRRRPSTGAVAPRPTPRRRSGSTRTSRPRSSARSTRARRRSATAPVREAPTRR